MGANVRSSGEKRSRIFNDRTMPLFFVYGVIVVLLIVANIIKPGFLSSTNISNLLRQGAFLGIVCIGQTLVILTGGIDISVDNMIVLTNVLSAEIMARQDANIPKALAVSLAVGVLFGLLNGAGVYYLKVPSLVMTLATGNILHGVAYIYCSGAPVGYSAPWITSLVNDSFCGLFTGTTLVWIVLGALCILLLKFTVFGRSVYAVGTSPLVSRYAGINAASTTIMCYVISGVCAALTGLLLVGYTGTSYMSIGGDYEASSIAAVVAGGTLISGGRGGYVGTIAGVVIMVVVSSLMTMLNVGEAGRELIQGLIIVALLLAVFSDKTKVRSIANRRGRGHSSEKNCTQTD